MHYSHTLFTRKGAPLAVVWRAGTGQIRKVSRREQEKVVVIKTTEQIGDAMLAVGTQGTLTLGVATIYREQRICHAKTVQRTVSRMRDRFSQEDESIAANLTARFADITFTSADPELRGLDNLDLELPAELAGAATVVIESDHLQEMQSSSALHDVEMDSPVPSDPTLQPDDESPPYGFQVPVEELGTMLGVMGEDEAAAFFHDEPPLCLGHPIAAAGEQQAGAAGGAGAADDAAQPHVDGGFGDQDGLGDALGATGPDDRQAAVQQEASAAPVARRRRAARTVPMLLDEDAPHCQEVGFNRRLKLMLSDPSPLVSDDPHRFDFSRRPKPKRPELSLFGAALDKMPTCFNNGNPTMQEMWAMVLRSRDEEQQAQRTAARLDQPARPAAAGGRAADGGAAGGRAAVGAVAGLGRDGAPRDGAVGRANFGDDLGGLEVMRDGEADFVDAAIPIDDALPLGFDDGVEGPLSPGGGGPPLGAFFSPGAELPLPISRRDSRRSSAARGGRSSEGARPDDGLGGEYEYDEGFGRVRASPLTPLGLDDGALAQHDLSRSYGRSTEVLMEQMSSLLLGASSSNFNEAVLPTMPTRRTKARCFVDLLTLASDRRLEIKQAQPYADIIVRRGPAFELLMADLPGATETIEEED